MTEHSIPCEACGHRRATTHWWYGHGRDARTGHFCHVCAAGRPPGHTVVAEVRPDPVWMLALLAVAVSIAGAFVGLLRS